jgi:hypothetical protein
MPTDSHNDGRRASYLLRTLQTLHLSLGFDKPTLFVGTPRLFCGNSYLWHVRVIIYERHMTGRICLIRLLIEASTLRSMFEGGMKDDAQEALAILRHEEDDQMEHSQYRHFPS